MPDSDGFHEILRPETRPWRSPAQANELPGPFDPGSEAVRRQQLFWFQIQ